MHRILVLSLAMVLAWPFTPAARAVVRLIGITGNQESNPAEDEALFEINLTNAATTKLFQAAHIPDTDSIGYNPVNGLLYHISGSSTYRDTPGQNGYRDNHYMETFDLEAANPASTGMAVFNANPPVVPDTSTALEFGLPGPFPSWVLPDHPRRDDENDPATGDLVGPDEYDSAREMAWSPDQNLFYLATGRGIYTMTPGGVAKFVGQPASEGGDMKGIEFVKVGNQTKLYAGSKEAANLYELDPTTGQEIGAPLAIMAPISADPGAPVESNHRILGLAQHPDTGVLYGLLEPIGSDPQFHRQLVTINLTTGLATLIGQLQTQNQDAAFASIAFVGFRTTAPGVNGDYNNNGVVDAADYVLWRDGGTLQNDPTQGVQPGDYDVWRANFGKTAGGGAALSAAVPEPAAASLLLMGMLLSFSLRRARAVV